MRGRGEAAMYPRNSVDQNDPSGLSSLQQERQAEMRRLSLAQQALEAGEPARRPARFSLRRRWVAALFGAALLALALAGIVAAVSSTH
jgi:hypothetical protein